MRRSGSAVRATISRCTRPGEPLARPRSAGRGPPSRRSTSTRRGRRARPPGRPAARRTGGRRRGWRRRPGRSPPRRARRAARTGRPGRRWRAGDPPPGGPGRCWPRGRGCVARGRWRPAVAGLAGRGVDDHDLAAQPRAGGADPLLGAQRVGAAPGDPGRQPGQGLEGGRAAGAVGGHADVALELAHRALGDRAEASVDPAGLEAELEELALQRDHVVAGLHAAGQVHQDAVAEAPVGLLERAVGRPAHDAVGVEATPLLEGADGTLERGVVLARVADGVGRQQLERHQPVLELDDLGGPVPEPEHHGGAARGGDVGHRLSR